MQKEELYSIKRLFLDYCKMDIKMPVICLIGAFLKSMAPYITIVLIGRLIDAVTLGVDVKTLIRWALVTIILSRLLTIISIKIKELESAKEEYMVEITNRVFAEKSLTEDYEHLEDPKWNNVRQQFEAMNKSGSGIFGKMFELLGKISEGVFSLLFSLVVMIPLIINKGIDSAIPFSGNLSAVIMIILVMALLVFKLKRGSVIMKEGLDTETVQSAPYTKKTGWYKDTLSVIENGKDIRIYDQLDGVKRDYNDADVYITATIKEVDELMEAKPEIIALDATISTRPNGQSLDEFYKEIRQKYPEQKLMADCSTVDEMIHADELGFDYIGSTLVGYTEQSKGDKIEANDFEILREVLKVIKHPLIAEGNIDTPEKVKRVLELGAYSVVVGSAITRPQLITKKFVEAIHS